MIKPIVTRHSSLVTHHSGFTLLETTVVIAIIAILASILFPVFARAREKARAITCASNLMQIGMALHMYAQDHGGRFPPEDNELGDVMPYVQNTQVFVCPSKVSNTPIYDYDKHWLRVTAYSYRSGLTNDAVGMRRLMYDADPRNSSGPDTRHNDGANVLFVSGRVKWFSYGEWLQHHWEPTEPIRK